MKVMKTKLSAGDWVEVRSKQDILRTLDSNGQLDGMPFMPEMFEFCGEKLQVYKRAHKTCDTVFPVRGRRVKDAVHLNTRCSGQAHGGCDATCLLFWKLEWLKPLEKKEQTTRETGSETHGCTEADVEAASKTIDPANGKVIYWCQATRLPYATTNLEWWDFRQYWEDLTSGNVGIGRILSGAIYMAAHSLSRAGVGLGRPIRWFYDKSHPLWGGTPYPRRTGTIPDDQPTPMKTLNLRTGELVQIKSYSEILQTLNTRSRNRGLYWDAEEVPYCGKTFRVLKRVERIINDKTGQMQEMKTPSVILDSVICESRYSECRFFCPRSIYPYWREIWLERVTPDEGKIGVATADGVAMQR
jgi:hypothetical protein